MRIQLIDCLPLVTEGVSTDLDLIACAESTEPVVAVTDKLGLAQLISVGINPIAVVTPSRSFNWQTRGRLERVLKRIGATSVVCRSDWAYNITASLSGVTPVWSDRAVNPLSSDVECRAARRRLLGLNTEHNLLVPLANRPEQIDSLVVCMCASALAIANVPLVMLLPSKAKHIDRARAFLSNADRVLRVVVTDIPTAFFAPAADAMIWGPHAIGEDSCSNAIQSIAWARGAGVPVLCPNQFLHADTEAVNVGALYSCNGTGAADVAAPLLSIFGCKPNG